MQDAVVRHLRPAYRAVLDALMPPLCPLCGDESPYSDDAAALCVACASQIPAVACFCRRCSAPVGPFLDTSRGCGHCRRDRFAFESVYSAGEYRGPLQSAVLHAKQPGGGPAAAWLADHLWKTRGEELASLTIDAIVPMPQHWLRRLTASHNTAELIARRLSARLKTPVDTHILRKVRRTPPQASLPPSKRRANLKQAFVAAVPRDGCRILLVDDVLTTGTTADRATRALHQAGAETVWVAAAARGVGV